LDDEEGEEGEGDGDDEDGEKRLLMQERIIFSSFLAYPGRSAISDGDGESSLTRLEQPSCSHSCRERFTNDNLKT